MSEQRRATLTPFGKSDKKSNKSPGKTVRLSFTLSDPNENSCPVFDYGAAVRTEARKKLKKHREEKDNKLNGFLDPFEDDDEDVKRLARKFEAKYGDKKKLKSYADLGAGYDETDPFIDNTDANDETLREDQETACGGYYINSGPLELRRVEVSDQSDADEVKRRGRKRSLPVIDEDDEEEEEEEDDKDVEEDKENEEEEDGTDRNIPEQNGEVVESKPVLQEIPSEPKKSKLLEEKGESEKSPIPSCNGICEEYSLKMKKKRRKRVVEDDANDMYNKTKKSKTVKTLLEEKRIQEQPVKALDEPKRHAASETSIAEAIESVVNAGNNHDENSNSSNSSHSAPTASSSASDESQDAKPSDSPPPLPEGLSAEVVALVEQIKRAAALTDNTRKTFHPDINNCLVKVEWKTRELSTASRNMLFAHLAHQLPCTKDTLMRRAKKLFIDKEESQMENVICKLKATIDATMPTLLERYQKECQKIAEEKGFPSNDSIHGGENQQAASPCDAKLPKRKFPWTDETRGYLLSIVRCKQRCYKICKPRKSTWEDYLKTFLHSSIRPLWPPGWMKTSALSKEVIRSPNSVKSKNSSHHNSRVDSTIPSNSANSIPPTPVGDTTKPSAVSTPLAAKSGSDPTNLSKITSSFSPPSQKKSSSHSPVKTEKPEFSMDCLLKRTSESTPCNDYNTTLSDLMKKEGLIVNGLSLPLKNVNNQNNNKSEKILDLSGCNNVSASVNATPSVIKSAPNERTTALSDSSARTISAEKTYNHTSPSAKESGGGGGERPRETDRETTTATDILSQIISESLRSPPPTPYNPPAKVKEEVKSQSQGQGLLHDVMQDLKELNHLSSGSGSARDTKSTSFTGASWAYPVKSLDTPKSSPFHNEYLNYVQHSNTTAQENPAPSQLPYSRHITSPYENSPHVNEVYSHSQHRSNQSIPSHTSSPANKASMLNQMKNLPNTGISSGSESQSHQ